MSSPDKTDAIFSEIDTNRDGRIDRNELRNWATSGTTGLDYDRETAIQTSGVEETNRYLATAGPNIYRDANPRIIRRTGAGSALTYEQRVSVKYLRPPTPPPPEPLIIKEIREPQPPPPPPLVICECAPSATTQAPLYLRERPPPPPPRIPGHTETRMIPGAPTPLRSVIIERFASAPAKPRDIVIERWLPYGPPPERRVIREPAPPLPKYSEATYTIVMHEGGDVRTNRKFENLGVTREDPQNYVARHGASLLDSATLVREARNAGVVEDLNAPAVASSTNTYGGGYSTGYDDYSSPPRRIHTSSGSSVGITSSRPYGGQIYDTGNGAYI